MSDGRIPFAVAAVLLRNIAQRDGITVMEKQALGEGVRLLESSLGDVNVS